MIRLIEENINAIMEQTKTKPQETLENKLNKQMSSFSYCPPINLPEEKKWLLALTNLEATNSVFEIIENINFSVTIPNHWSS